MATSSVIPSKQHISSVISSNELATLSDKVGVGVVGIGMGLALAYISWSSENKWQTSSSQSLFGTGWSQGVLSCEVNHGAIKSAQEYTLNAFIVLPTVSKEFALTEAGNSVLT